MSDRGHENASAPPRPTSPASLAKTRAASRKEGLRERKKRLTRQYLSETATTMFLEHGFDKVRVTEIAAACDVSEKTVFNYFPTKEALLLNQLDDHLTHVRIALSDRRVPPLQAVLHVLSDELEAITSWDEGREDAAAVTFQRFAGLVYATPSLRSYYNDQQDQVTATLSDAVAMHAGLSAEDPQVVLAALGLAGLWRIQYRALQRHLVPGRSQGTVRSAVAADVARAVQILQHGLAANPDLA